VTVRPEAAPAEYVEKWVRRYHPAPEARVRLVCLPHAGGSATFFFPVAKALAPEVEVLAVQYPGRQDRRHETVLESVPELVERILAALRHLDDRPLALFGHSMGATLAYELALRLPSAGLPAPTHLFASGRRAPSRYRDERVHEGSDERLVAELRFLSGTSADMLADPEVLGMILPAIRGDYRAVETYRHDPGRRLDCPITILTGDEDPKVSLDEAAAWAGHTIGPSDLRVLPGGHFFLVDRAADVLGILREKLGASREVSAS
jgi:surfactin synthase thioesterase subunit